MQGIDEPRVLLVAALEAVHRPGHVGEILEVARALEVLAVHAGREAQHLGIGVLAHARDERGQPLDHVLEGAGAAVEAGHAHVEQETLRHQTIEEVAAHHAHGSSPSEKHFNSLMVRRPKAVSNQVG